jgi:hypothetical protein
MGLLRNSSPAIKQRAGENDMTPNEKELLLLIQGFLGLVIDIDSVLGL